MTGDPPSTLRVATLPFGAQRREPLAVLPPGTLVDQYVLEHEIGQGGMATVYAAVHPILGKRAAVKVLGREHCNNPAAVTLFLQEARAISQIGHPNLVDVFGYGRLPDGRSYFVMDLLEGTALIDAMQAGMLSLTQVYDVVTQTTEALQAAHDRHIAHLDLKPENVYLVPLGRGRTLVKLLDFGIARLIGEPAQIADGERVFRGTPSYASPEQCMGSQEIDTRSDLYSLGVMTYQLVTGRLPFKGATQIYTLTAHVHQPPPPPRRHCPELPVELERLILRLLYKEPARRPGLDEVRETLAALAKPAALPVRPVSARRFGAWPIAVGALGVVALVGWGRGDRTSATAVLARRAFEDEPRPTRADPPAAEIDPAVLDALSTLESRAAEVHKRVSRATRRVRRPLVATPALAPSAAPATSATLDADYLIDEEGRRR